MAIRNPDAQAAVAAAAVAVLVLFWPPARALPVSPNPNLCVDRNPNVIKCCPSRSNADIINFTPPPSSSPLRIRRPAHSLDPAAAQKYANATALMRSLQADHPWNFIQQSNVHCAYCAGGHLHSSRNITLEIHFSWLFFPWHRAFLYFYERILGKLVGDPSFALPF
ncbi:Aureusidin synthase [Apostasia shenzhenica]|uniref:Aureusidin synthase n=1 Tax=Apostasia shenzhenica TaxID=1088818 RepID=A0A2H9ZS98_9ASPA|nr:Aureusidin synthase [Apostasia shenzhenica]